MDIRDRLQNELKALENGASRRRLVERNLSADELHLDTNDYLDVARQNDGSSASHPPGSTASRLVSGTHAEHLELERAIAGVKGTESALVFGSGYLTACGVFQALCGRHDTVVADRLIHACVIDGVKLSGAKLVRFRHNDAEHAAELLAKSRSERPDSTIILVTETVFSMDGDRAPLDALRTAAAQHDALFMVDEAHSSGISPSPKADLLMGTLSKAYGSYGGYVACEQVFHDWFVNRARSFIYTTAPPPGVMASALNGLKQAQDLHLGERLLERAARLRQHLQEEGLDTGNSDSQIIPVIIGDNLQTLDAARRLREQGIHVAAIRPPTVPAGSARLRLSLTLGQPADDKLTELARTIAKAVRG